MATTLTPSEMKQRVADHFEDFVNRRKAGVIHANMTPDFYDHDGPGGKPTGIEGDEQMMLKMYEMMPDLHLTIEDIIAEGDKVVCRNLWRWTDPITRKKMQFHGFVLWRFEGVKIAERWATVTTPAEGDSWTKDARREGKAMKVALCGATGRAGSRILKELLTRGHQVVAIVREAGAFPAGQSVTVAVDDLSDAIRTAEVIKGLDATICAYAPPSNDPDELANVTRRLTEAIAQSGVPRFLMVGGAGSLEISPGLKLSDSGKLPPEWMPLALAHAQALEILRSSAIDWTYLSPAVYFEPGERTGHFRLGTDNLIATPDGDSRISMEDYAIAMVDELENPKHRGQRFSVGY